MICSYPINLHSVVHCMYIGLGNIEALQSHVNETIYKLAYRLIDTYFDSEEDDQTITPAQSNQQYLFATNTNLPPGGFQL